MKNYVKYILALVIFGSNGVFASMIAMSSGELVFMRTVIGGAFLLLVMVIGRQWTQREILKREFWRLILSGICLGVNWILLFEAYKQMSVSLATLAYYCAPVIVLAVSPVVLGEKLDRRAFVGIAVVVVGMILATGIGGHATPIGMACGLGSALFYAGLILVNKKIEGVGGLNLTFFELVIAAIVLLPYVLISHGGVHLPSDTKGILALLFLCIVNTGVACWLYFSSMNQLPARTVALCGYIDPISALLFSAVFLNEHLTVIQLIGAVFVLAGAILGQPKQSRETSDSVRSAL